MEIKDLQFFYLAVIAFGLIGIQRGWRREVVSLVFALTGVVFLFFGLGNALAQFIFLRLPTIIQLAFTGSVNNTQATTLSDSDPRVFLTTILTFIIVVIAGYLIGNRVFPKPAVPQERILGVIPAVIAGFVMVDAATTFVKNQIILAVDTPSQSSFGNYLSIIFVIAIAALVLALLVASARKKVAPVKK